MHDLLGYDGPPSIRQLAMQGITQRNDAIQDERRDLKFQPPTVLQQAHDDYLTNKEEKTEEDEEEAPPPKKRVRFNEPLEEKESVALHTNNSASRSDNMLLGILILFAVVAVCFIAVRSCKKDS